MTIERQIATRNHHAVKTGKMGRYLNIHCSLEIAKAAATLKRLAYLTPYYAVTTLLVLIAVICLTRIATLQYLPETFPVFPGRHLANCVIIGLGDMRSLVYQEYKLMGIIPDGSIELLSQLYFFSHNSFSDSSPY